MSELNPIGYTENYDGLDILNYSLDDVNVGDGANNTGAETKWWPRPGDTSNPYEDD